MKITRHLALVGAAGLLTACAGAAARSRPAAAAGAADGNWVGGQRTRDLQSYPTTYNAGAGTVTIG